MLPLHICYDFANLRDDPLLLCLLCSKPYGGRPRGRNSGRGGAAMDNPDDSALRRLGLPISSSGRDRLQGNSDSRWKIIVSSVTRNWP